MSNLLQQIDDATSRRMDAAAIELTNALKETLSVPVPRLVNRLDKNAAKVRSTQTNKLVYRRATFIKDGKGLTIVKRGAIRTLTNSKGKTETYTVPGDYTTYRKANGDPVFVKRATKGAPPRKFEGRLRAGHTWERRDFVDNGAQYAFSVTGPRSSGSLFIRRVGTNVKYAPVHENGVHPYFVKTLNRVRPKLESILGQSI